MPLSIKSSRRLTIFATLIAYVFMHAAVPPGFMLADNGGGELFQLCHGDEHSAALMEFMQEQHADESQVDEQPETVSHGELNQCLSAFIAFATLAKDTYLGLVESSKAVSAFAYRRIFSSSKFVGDNPARAPPSTLT